MKTSNKIILATITSFVIFAFLPIFILRSSLGDTTSKIKEGNQKQIVENRYISDYEELLISDMFDIELQQADQYELKVEADSNLLSDIITEKDANTLRIHIRKGIRLKQLNTPKIYIKMPALNHLAFFGAGTLKIDQPFTSKDLKVVISGAATMNLNLQTTTLQTTMQGAGAIKLTGATQYFETSITGTGNLDAADFIAQNANINISGTGNASVNVIQTLDANISGTGNISYTGDPKQVNKHISGIGQINSK